MLNLFQKPSSSVLVYLGTIIASLIFSFISLYDALPNNDGILYLETAEIYLQNGFAASLKNYHWPFFSIAIAYTSILTKFSLLNSAYLLDIILQAIIAVTFLKIAHTIYPSNINTRKNIYIYSSIILFFIFPQFNEYRHYILRDYGFWAFSLIGIVFLLKICTLRNSDSGPQYKQYYNLILYYFSFLCAFLFRAEALVIVIMLPIGVIFSENTFKQKINLLLTIYFPVIICVVISIIGLTILSFNKEIYISLYHTLYLNLHFNKLEKIFNIYAANSEIINNHLFAITPNNNISMFFFFVFGLFAVFLVKFITSLNLLNTALVFLSYKLFTNSQHYHYLKSNHINTNALIIVTYSAAIFLLLPLIFLYLIFVTSGRYYILGCLLLLLLAPIAVNYLWMQLSTSTYYAKNKILISSIIFLFTCSIGLAGIVSFGHSKEYIKQASYWYHSQKLPINHLVMTNNSQLNYLIHLPHKAVEDFDIAQNTEFEYMLLKVKKNEKAVFSKIKLLEDTKKITILKIFSNNSKDSVFILRKNN